MKKLICLLLALLTVIACVPAIAEQESKALVLYFDYSENIDTTGLDVDAISQASMAGTRARDTLPEWLDGLVSVFEKTTVGVRKAAR